MRGRGLRTFALAGLVAAALCATWSPAASAAQFETSFLSEAAIESSGPSEQVLVIEESPWPCRRTTFKSEQRFTWPRASFLIHPNYLGCTTADLFASVISNGCNWEVSAPGAVVVGRVPGELKIRCETGKTISYEASSCKTEIGSQTVSSGVTLENLRVNGVFKVLLDLRFAPIQATKTKDGTFCPFAGKGPIVVPLTGSVLLQDSNFEGFFMR